MDISITSDNTNQLLKTVDFSLHNSIKELKIQLKIQELELDFKDGEDNV